MTEPVLIKRKIRLVLKKAEDSTFERVECQYCQTLLFKAQNFLKKTESDKVSHFLVEIKCQKCHEINIF